MSVSSTIQAHIAYELLDDTDPAVVVIDFLTGEIVSPVHAHELGEQLVSLIRPDLPQHFLIDFADVRSLGNSAFDEIVTFACKVKRLCICNLKSNLRLGAALAGLDECVELTANRRAGINAARKAAIRGQEDTVDYPASRAESN